MSLWKGSSGQGQGTEIPFVNKPLMGLSVSRPHPGSRGALVVVFRHDHWVPAHRKTTRWEIWGWHRQLGQGVLPRSSQDPNPAPQVQRAFQNVLPPIRCLLASLCLLLGNVALLYVTTGGVTTRSRPCPFGRRMGAGDSQVLRERLTTAPLEQGPSAFPPPALPAPAPVPQVGEGPGRGGW